MKQNRMGGKGRTNKSFTENRQHIAGLNVDFHSIIQQKKKTPAFNNNLVLEAPTPRLPTAQRRLRNASPFLQERLCRECADR